MTAGESNHGGGQDGPQGGGTEDERDLAGRTATGPAPAFPVLHPTQAAAPVPEPEPAPEPVRPQPQVAVPSPSYAEPRTEPIAVRRRERSRRSRWAVVAAAVAAVLVAGGVSYGLLGGHGGGGGQARAGASEEASTKPAGSGQQRGDGLNGSTTGPDGSSLAAGGGSRRTPSANPADPSHSAGATTAPAGHVPGTQDPTSDPTTAAPPATTPPNSHPTTTPPVSKSCGGWSHRDPDPGTYGYMTGSYHIEVGPYASCTDVALVPSGKKVWYHCYVLNAYGHKWWWVRISGTNTAGWMSADNLRGQTGPSTRC